MDLVNQREQLLCVLLRVWSRTSSSKWTPENPANGQCGVTALVVQDVLGGEIHKTKTPDGWHFYNRINDQRHDFTASQFDSPIEYADIVSSREEAFSDTNADQYGYLRQSVFKHLSH